MSGINDLIKIKPLTEYNKYLFIGPHPDDIEFGCGGLISKLKELNKEYYYCIITDGSASSIDKNSSSDDMKNIRHEEALKASKYLGCKKVFFLDLEDGGSYTIEDIIEGLLKVILEVKPDIMFGPDPHTSTECHIDHIKAGYAIRFAEQLVGYPHSVKRHNVDINKYDEFIRNITLVQYFSDSCNYYEKISKKNLEEKLESLRMHVSQNSGEEGEALLGFMDTLAKVSGFKTLKGLAEGFLVLPPTFQHVYNLGVKPTLFSLLFKK